MRLPKEKLTDISLCPFSLGFFSSFHPPLFLKRIGYICRILWYWYFLFLVVLLNVNAAKKKNGIPKRQDGETESQRGKKEKEEEKADSRRNGSGVSQSTLGFPARSDETVLIERKPRWFPFTFFHRSSATAAPKPETKKDDSHKYEGWWSIDSPTQAINSIAIEVLPRSFIFSLENGYFKVISAP